MPSCRDRKRRCVEPEIAAWRSVGQNRRVIISTGKDGESPRRDVYALEVAGAVKSFGRTRALDGCSFVVPTGALCALAGLNGSGKTTVLKAAAGLLALNSGSVRIEGRATRLGEVPAVTYLAQARSLPANLRVHELLGYAAALAGEGGFAESVARDWLEEHEVDQNALVGSLSGGQRTQVALAVAVARTAPVLTLDEPMADLDPLARERMADGLKRLVSEARTIVVSSHAVAELASWCDYVVVLDAGRAVLSRGVTDLTPGELERLVLDTLRTARDGGRRSGSPINESP